MKSKHKKRVAIIGTVGLPAKWYLFWAESLAVEYSHIDISDNEAIQDCTAARYGTLSRIVELDKLLIEEAISADAKSKVLPEVSHLSYSTLLKLGKAHFKTSDQFSTLK